MLFSYNAIHLAQVMSGPAPSPSRDLGTRETEANALMLTVLGVLCAVNFFFTGSRVLCLLPASENQWQTNFLDHSYGVKLNLRSDSFYSEAVILTERLLSGRGSTSPQARFRVRRLPEIWWRILLSKWWQERRQEGVFWLQMLMRLSNKWDWNKLPKSDFSCFLLFSEQK